MTNTEIEKLTFESRDHLQLSSLPRYFEMKPSKSFLRQRAPATVLVESNGDAAEHPQDDRERREEVVWGKTPGGEGIAIHSFLEAIFLLYLG